ncbi:uncharacterized protein LOC123526694 [Mercenaria mercenaria]|uniref:uncharacterized protein LOC123526694 n=1 Tax=Mercenaria mercenaria TaxID=6596 RepID=UPI00234F52EF|nr:uncharacterized protein LOC123526694 [Mercenaria mercenaria]
MSSDTCRWSNFSISEKLETNNKIPMGSRFSSKWVQARIRRKTSVFRHQTYTSFRKATKLNSERNTRSFNKKCDRSSRQNSDSFRILQQVISSSQEKRGNETSYKLKTTQQVFEEKAFQDGNYAKSPKSSSERRLRHKSRPKRWLFPFKNIQKSPQISSFLFQRDSLPVSGTLLWPNVSTKGILQDNVSHNSIPETTRTSSIILSRRLVNAEPNIQKVVRRQKVSYRSPFSTRFNWEQEKVIVSSVSDIFLHRGSVQYEDGASVPHTRKNFKAQNSSVKCTARQYISKTLPNCVGYNSFLSRPDSKCKVVHETNSAPLTAKLESCQNVSVSYSSIDSFAQIPSKMVASRSEHFEGKISSTCFFSSHYNHRCEWNVGLGWSHEQPYSARPLVKVREIATHQHSGNESCNVNCPTFSSCSRKQECIDQIGQHLGMSIHQSPGGYTFTSSMSSDLGLVGFSPETQYESQSSPHHGEVQQLGGLFEQEESARYRVESEQNSDNTNFQSMGLSPHRSVCNIREQTDNTVLFMVSTSPSFSTGCPVSCMAEHVCICISPSSVNSEGSESHAAVPVQVDSHSPKLAEAALVSSSAKNVDSKTNQITSNSESVDTRQRESNASKSRDIAVGCMATIDRAFRTRGFSENTRKLLAASWRKGTQKDYNCKFRKFNSWCSEQEIDPYTASLTDCAHFLTFLFDKGLKYKTITGYRSILSSLLAPIEKFPVGQHPFIIRLLRGIFNQRPPLRKLVPEWDLPLVLGCLKKPPFEPMKEAFLKYVTWKTCFLIAVTCFRRCSDIQALRLSKQDRPNHHSRKIFVPSFPSNKLLDPKRAMTYYLKKRMFQNSRLGK